MFQELQSYCNILTFHCSITVFSWLKLKLTIPRGSMSYFEKVKAVAPWLKNGQESSSTAPLEFPSLPFNIINGHAARVQIQWKLSHSYTSFLFSFFSLPLADFLCKSYAKKQQYMYKKDILESTKLENSKLQTKYSCTHIFSHYHICCNIVLKIYIAPLSIYCKGFQA